MISASSLRGFLAVMKKQAPDEWDWAEPEQTSALPDLFWCVVTYQASRPPFRFFVEFNEEILCVQYLLPADTRIHPDCCLALYRILLRLNEELALVKFGLTHQGNITLMGEPAGCPVFTGDISESFEAHGTLSGPTLLGN